MRSLLKLRNKYFEKLRYIINFIFSLLDTYKLFVLHNKINSKIGNFLKIIVNKHWYDCVMNDFQKVIFIFFE